MTESIRVEGVSKTFAIAQGPARAATIVRALVDITFGVNPGSFVGVIGRNGSGKTTLLRLLCGSLQQDAGTVSVDGLVAAVPILGTEFNGNATGREGVRSLIASELAADDVDAFLLKVEEFAELGPFFDAPINAYSTGMAMRLALSQAICLNPDVLLLDEVFAVSDEAFEARCLDAIAQVRKRDKTVVFATHKMEIVEERCDFAIWLDRGRIAGLGDPRGVVAAYRAFSDSELSGCS